MDRISLGKRRKLEELWMSKGHGNYPKSLNRNTDFIRQDTVHKVLQRAVEWACNRCDYATINNSKTWAEACKIIKRGWGRKYPKLASKALGWIGKIVRAKD